MIRLDVSWETHCKELHDYNEFKFNILDRIKQIFESTHYESDL